MTLLSRAGWTVVVVCAVQAFSVAAAGAATHTWTGLGGNALWSNAGNWTGGVPATGESGAVVVVFDGATTSTMDIAAGVTVDDLKLNVGNNTINGSGGGALTFNGANLVTNVESSGPGNVLGATLPLAVANTAPPFVKASSGTLTISGTIGGPPLSSLRFLGASAGDGTTIGHTGRIAVPGTTTVASGTLTLDNSGVDQAAGGASVAVGVAGGPAATLRLNQSLEIANTTDVVVQSNGTFDVAGFSDTIDALQVTDGAVTLGTGTLTPGGGLTMTGGTISGTGSTGLVLGADVNATSSAAQSATISSRVALEGARRLTVGDGPAPDDLVITGVIFDGTAGASIVKDGAGTLWLHAGISNLYTGGTTIADGTLRTLATVGRAIPVGGTITVGDDAGAASSAVLRFGINNDIDSTTGVVVKSDGQVDLNGFTQSVAAMTLQDGRVSLPTSSILTIAGQLGMTGGTIDGPGALRVKTVSATSSAAGRAHIGSPIQMSVSGTGLFTVTPGTAPELEVTGAMTPLSGFPGGFAKAGAGTMIAGGANTLPGPVDVQAGTLVMNGTQTTPVSVGALGTLAGTGTVGATTVSGVLAPGAPALHSGDLAFTPTAKLQIDGPASAALPHVEAHGTVTINAGAALALGLATGVVPPTGTQLTLIDNDGADAVAGAFANAADGATLTSADGLPFTVGYASGDGNDLAVTAANVAPVLSVSPAGGVSAAVGEAVALTASATDANQDPLTFSWDFGDGTTASGAAASHAYATAGTYTATVTVSDGRASVQASRLVTVTATTTATVPTTTTAPPPGGPPGGPGPIADTRPPKLTFTAAKRQKLSAKGTFAIRLTCDEACTVTLSTAIKPPGRHARTRRASTKVKLKSGRPVTVKVAVPRSALSAVRTMLRRHRTVTVSVSATARDAAGNAGKPLTRRSKLKR